MKRIKNNQNITIHIIYNMFILCPKTRCRWAESSTPQMPRHKIINQSLTEHAENTQGTKKKEEK